MVRCNTSDFDEIYIICISHEISQIPIISDAFDYCKHPLGALQSR